MRSLEKPYSLLIAFLFIMEHYKNLDLADIVYFCEIDNIEKVEQWLPIVDYEVFYQVSDLGRIKSLSRLTNNERGIYITKPKILRQGKSKKYLTVVLFGDLKKTFTVHCAVSVSFLNHVPCGFEKVINHKNFNTFDNRKTNLEITTSRENCNRAHIASTSRYVGVCWEKQSMKWVARIHINKKRKTIGRFKTEIEASNAYQKELKKVLQ